MLSAAGVIGLKILDVLVKMGPLILMSMKSLRPSWHI